MTVATPDPATVHQGGAWHTPTRRQAMDSCPACTASLTRNGTLHCGSGHCAWIKCNTCGVTIDADTATYWEPKQLIWGNLDGYLKAQDT